MASPGSETEKIIKQYCEQLKKMGIVVEQTILFGSHARGEAREGSDIDLVIISSAFKNMSTRERLELLGIAAARLWQPIEALGYTPEELAHIEPATFLENIMQTGTPIG
jgi:predicted nucleotidyltransferase